MEVPIILHIGNETKLKPFRTGRKQEDTTSVLQENALNTRVVTILAETLLTPAAESLPAKQVLLRCKARLRDNSSWRSGCLTWNAEKVPGQNPLLLACFKQKIWALLNPWKKEDKNLSPKQQSRGWAQSSPFISPDREDATLVRSSCLESLCCGTWCHVYSAQHSVAEAPELSGLPRAVWQGAEANYSCSGVRFIKSGTVPS